MIHINKINISTYEQQVWHVCVCVCARVRVCVCVCVQTHDCMHVYTHIKDGSRYADNAQGIADWHAVSLVFQFL